MDRVDGGATASVKSTTDKSGAHVVSIAGELDVSNVGDVEQHVLRIIGNTTPDVIFDLSSLTFMDSSGIAMLLRCAEKTASLTIRKPTRTVQLIIDATGLADVLRVES
jgi:anti-anti-sigma factor